MTRDPGTYSHLLLLIHIMVMSIIVGITMLIAVSVITMAVLETYYDVRVFDNWSKYAVINSKFMILLKVHLLSES